MPSAFDPDTRFQPLPRAALKAARIGAVLGAVLFAVAAAGPLWALVAVGAEAGFGSWLLLVLCMAALLLAGGWLLAGARWRRTGWRLDDDGLAIRRGLLWRSETLVPRSRVQHVDLSHGPLDRYLGLAGLKVHTAGTRLAAVTLAGLEQATAEALRDVLVEDGQGDGDASAPLPVAGADHGG